MNTEEKFAAAYNTVAEMMDRAKASPQKEAIELLLDTVMVFIEELKRAAQAPKSTGGERHYHQTQNGHRYEVQADTSVANQQNIYQNNYTTHQYVYHEPQALFRDIWVLPGNLKIDMAAVEYYDREASQLHLRSGKVIDIQPNQVGRLLSWYYMHGYLRQPQRYEKKEVERPRPKIPNDPAKSAEIIAQIKAELRK